MLISKLSIQWYPLRNSNIVRVCVCIQLEQNNRLRVNWLLCFKTRKYVSLCWLEEEGESNCQFNFNNLHLTWSGKHQRRVAQKTAAASSSSTTTIIRPTMDYWMRGDWRAQKDVSHANPYDDHHHDFLLVWKCVWFSCIKRAIKFQWISIYQLWAKRRRRKNIRAQQR